MLPFLRPSSSPRSLLFSICTLSVLFISPSDHPSSLPSPPYLRPILRTRDFKFVRGGVARFAHRESRLTSPGDQRNVKSVRTKFHRRPIRFSRTKTSFKAREILAVREVVPVKYAAYRPVVLRTYVSSLVARVVEKCLLVTAYPWFPFEGDCVIKKPVRFLLRNWGIVIK